MFAILNPEPEQQWQQIQEALFMGQYMGGSGCSNTEIWEFFNAFELTYPSDEQLQRIKAIIVPGSACCAIEHKTVPWMGMLRDFIKHVYEKYPHVKILGICFGA